MSIKGCLSILLAGIVLLGAAGCFVGAPEPIQATPPFWEVTHPESGARLYLLGSMHVGQEGIVYPEYILSAFDICDTVAVEVDTQNYEYSELVQASRWLLTPDSTSTAECLGESYEQAVGFLRKKGVYQQALEQYIPYYWCSTLTMGIAEECGLSAEYGTEAIFLTMAGEQDKQIVEIESLEQQYSMMAAIPMEVQVQTLTQSIGDDNYAQQVEATREMYEDWLHFDVEGLEALNEESIADSDSVEGYEEFIELMYISRQQRMAEFAAECLESGEDVFMLVGAAHFYIEEDILTLLGDKGYIIEEIRS